MIELANEQQLRLLISLHRQVGVPIDSAELATLTKWQAAERINALRGRPSTSPDELQDALMDVLQKRAQATGEPEPDPGAAKPKR